MKKYIFYETINGVNYSHTLLCRDLGDAEGLADTLGYELKGVLIKSILITDILSDDFEKESNKYSNDILEMINDRAKEISSNTGDAPIESIEKWLIAKKLYKE